MSDPFAPPRVDVPSVDEQQEAGSFSALGSNADSVSPSVLPTIDASGRVVFAEVEGDEEEEGGLEHEAPPGFGFQPVLDGVLEDPALELDKLQLVSSGTTAPTTIKAKMTPPGAVSEEVRDLQMQPRLNTSRSTSTVSEGAVRRMSEKSAKAKAGMSRMNSRASREIQSSESGFGEEMENSTSLSWWSVAADPMLKAAPKPPPPLLGKAPTSNESKVAASSRRTSQALDGQFNLIEKGLTSSTPKENGEFTTATAHYLEKAKGLKTKQRQLEARNREFIHNKTSADILAKVRLGYISIADFMTHYNKMDQKEKTALIQRLVPSTLRTHNEVDRQVRLVEIFTEMQEETKEPGQLEDLLQRVARDVLSATGAKIYLVNESTGRVQRLTDPRLSCSYLTEGPRMCIIQAAAQSRMPVTINNAWSHHHYNDKWDGPKARSLMCLPMWKNAEPREGEMIGVLHIFRTNEEKFTRSDETIARMAALVAGPTLEQLVHIVTIASLHEVGPDNARLLNEHGVRCLSIALNDSMSATSCRTEMTQLVKEAEKLISIAVNASQCNVYFLDNSEKSLFASRARRTQRGQLHEHFHLVHGMAGEVCTLGKSIRVDLEAAKDDRASLMGRADRLRERFENEKLRNIMVVPMFAAPKDAAAIRGFSLGLKPTTTLPVEDTDVLRVHIATETRKPPKRSKLMSNTVLSRWAALRFEDDSNKRQLVGAVQVCNAVREHSKGSVSGKRMFLDEDQEVMKEVVDFVVQMMCCVLRRFERQVDLNRAYKLADKLEALAWAAPQMNASLDPEVCAHAVLNQSLTLMNADWARLYVLIENEPTTRFDARTVQVFSTVAGEEQGGNHSILLLTAPPMLREAFHARVMTRARSSDIEEGGSWVQGVELVGGRVTADVMCNPLQRTAHATTGPGKAHANRFPHISGDPLSTLIGALVVGTYKVDSGRSGKELAAEVVMEEVGTVASMAVSNFVKAIHLAAIRAATPAPFIAEPSIKTKRAIKFDDEA